MAAEADGTVAEARDQRRRYAQLEVQHLAKNEQRHVEQGAVTSSVHILNIPRKCGVGRWQPITYDQIGHWNQWRSDMEN